MTGTYTAVEACGVCHTDAATVTGTYPGLTLQRVPGHEVVRRIDRHTDQLPQPREAAKT